MWPFRKKKEPEYPKDLPPPPSSGWDTTLLALGSGIGIMAQPFLKINPVTAVAVGEGSGMLLDAAKDKHKKEQELLRQWHVELVRRDADRLVEEATSIAPEDLTDKDRIRLALFVEWGLIDEEKARTLPRALQAEILLTELAIAVKQSDMNSVQVANTFAFPALQHQDPSSPAALKAMLEDKLRMYNILHGPKDDSLTDKAGKRITRGIADAAINVLTKPASILRSATSLIVDLPALKQVYNIVASKGASPTADHFIDKACKDLQSSYEKGLVTVRRAERRQLREQGIDYESVLVKKPEGGVRHIVRPKKDGPSP